MKKVQRADRARTLIAAHDATGEELAFITDRRTVHVVADSADWPIPDTRHGFVLGGDVLSAALGDTWTVCGLRMSRHRGGVDNGAQVIPWFNDDLLCQNCHHAFGDRSALIFENNHPQCPHGCNATPALHTDGRWCCGTCGWHGTDGDG